MYIYVTRPYVYIIYIYIIHIYIYTYIYIYNIIYEMRSGQNPILMLVGCCSKPRSNMNRRPTHHLGNILCMSIYCTVHVESSSKRPACPISLATPVTSYGHGSIHQQKWGMTQLFASTGRVVPSALQSRQ